MIKDLTYSMVGKDFQLLNECLWENYNWVSFYMDDNLKKTSEFLEAKEDNENLLKERF